MNPVSFTLCMAGNRRRRASVYLVTINAALVIAVVGVAALLALRVERRSLRDAGLVAEARFAARSAAELGMQALASDPTWRTKIPHDQWQHFTTNTWKYCYKLVDEIDGNLADDNTEPVRLYFLATRGSITRRGSVLLEPQITRNLLNNGNFSNGTTGWAANGTCTLTTRNDGSGYNGTPYLYVYNRSGTSSGPKQDVSWAMTSGETYYMEAVVAPTLLLDAVNLRLTVRTTTATYTWSLPGLSVLSWTKLSTSFTPTWQGKFLSAEWSASSTSLTAPPFRLDEAMLVPGTGPPPATPPMKPVLSTWRQEVLP